MAQSSTPSIVRGEDGRRRCAWGHPPALVTYHDEEWGRPVADDIRLYEKLCLEGFPSGLSWLTSLRKREGFRKAFAGFDPVKVADYTEQDVARLLNDVAIVRHSREDRGDDRVRSTALSKELRRRGFRFVWPTTVHAAMQAIGVVNDHVKGCDVRSACDRERRDLSIAGVARGA